MGAVLALDYGTSRIGIAVSDPTRTLATAVAVHRAGRDGPVSAFVAALVRERGVDQLVVGLPLTADGRLGEIAERAQRFAGKLGEELGLPVALVDERYTTQEAERLLRGPGRRRSRESPDAVAAELILQQYLDAAGAGRDGGA
ncbi:MAG: Holliday junction resolvase RuvX [Gemmatimonas sp.]|nr:Holliday junction resolvase RuvX [Gemmatimonas sp.]